MCIADLRTWPVSTGTNFPKKMLVALSSLTIYLSTLSEFRSYVRSLTSIMKIEDGLEATRKRNSGVF